MGPYHFLVVANTFDGQTTTISSTVYVWLDGRFRTFQNITVSVSCLCGTGSGLEVNIWMFLGLEIWLPLVVKLKPA